MVIMWLFSPEIKLVNHVALLYRGLNGVSVSVLAYVTVICIGLCHCYLHWFIYLFYMFNFVQLSYMHMFCSV